MTENALVIGQGSIGQRHARLLTERGCVVSTVSGHAHGSFRSVASAFADRAFDHVVVANVTAVHSSAVAELDTVGFAGDLLIEKPLCNNLAACGVILDAARRTRFAAVGYNLRFHPAVQQVRAQIAAQPVVEARLSVGQSLPTWRTGTDFRAGSSALLAAGGGALRDLSHELDLALYLFGPCEALVASGGNLGRLSIETDEAWGILMKMRSGALIQVSMNYFDHPPQRRIDVTTCQAFVAADLVASTVTVDGERTHYPVQRDDTYRLLHDAVFSASPQACSLTQGVEVMRLIAAVEQSSKQMKWVQL